MNLSLVPYTWMRHVHVGLFCGGAALVAWWIVVTTRVGTSFLDPGWDGPILLSAITFATTGSALLAEGLLRRTPWLKRLGIPLAAATAAALIVLGWCGLYARWVVGWIFEGADAAEASLVSLRYQITPWLIAGGVVGMSAGVARRLKGFGTHLGSGLAAGALAGGTWHAAGYAKFEIGPMDLFAASALAAMVFGTTFGIGAWGIPDSLYAGWVRVVSRVRHGRRIPVDGATAPRERFIGHFPRGLDLFLGAEGKVNELHVSVRVDGEQVYRARGLTIEPTLVRRFLERIDLRYDPRRPAPLETRLDSGDRIVLGDKTVLEFLMLPKEET